MLIEVDLRKPISHDRTIKFNSQNLWIPIQWEKLHKVCFTYGCMFHGKDGCTFSETVKLRDASQFGSWLRATYFGGRNGGSNSLGRENSSKGSSTGTQDSGSKEVEGGGGTTNNSTIVGDDNQLPVVIDSATFVAKKMAIVQQLSRVKPTLITERELVKIELISKSSSQEDNLKIDALD